MVLVTTVRILLVLTLNTCSCCGGVTATEHSSCQDCQVTHGTGLTSPLSRQSEIIREDQYLMQRLLPFGFNYN